jgi:trimethylamine---corrinoid protein Co-methyltransferase
MTEDTATRSRHGGREGRRRERSDKRAARHGSPGIVRNIPTYDILGEENLIRIEHPGRSRHRLPRRPRRA